MTGAGDVDRTGVPFTVDRTPQPDSATAATSDPDLTGVTSGGVGDPDLTAGSSGRTADPDRAVAPADATANPDRTIAPGEINLTGLAELPPGTKLGSRYTVIRTLGRGGMGVVYQAWDDELGVAVAIKTILPGHARDEHTRRDQVGRFKSELLLARQVTHKNVVRIHDLGEVGGLKYITMAYVEGETLAALIKRLGPLAPSHALALTRQIADGMAAAHDVGVVHRDLKPENVIVTRGGQALIMDFGIAHSSREAPTSGGVSGTIGYMAPEQAAGGVVDARADIYAFGLMVYDMLVGRQRLKSHPTPMDELRARSQAAPPGVRTLRDDVPEAFERVVTRAVQPAPDDRFPDTTALREALAGLTDDGDLKPVPRPRPRWPAVTAGVLVSALVVTGIWRYISPPPVAARPPLSVLIANFENRTGDPLFDGVLEQALSLGVEGASFITAYPRREALRVAASISPGATLDEKTTRVVALREEVAVVLAGMIERQGAGYHISLRALPGGDQDGELYASSAAAADKAAVLPAVGELAISVREALGDTETPDGGSAANESFTAASLEAARAYAAAQDLQWSGRIEDAIAQYRETLRLDPEMGRAYSGLAAQYANTGRLAEAEANYQQALARIDRMTDREKFRTRGSYYLFARKPDLAFQEFTALVKAFPADTSGLTNLALASFYRREMSQALDQGRRAAAIFPKSLLQRSNVALYAMYAGRFEEAIAEAAAVHEINRTHLKAFVARALSLLALDRVPEARTTYDQLAATGPAGESFAAGGRADLALYEGRFSDAAALLGAAVKADLARDNPAGAARKRLALAEARLAQGDSASAAREAATAAAASEADSVRASAGSVLAAAGRASQAEALAAGLEQKLETDPQAYGRIIRVELALARNDGRRAVELAREAQKLSDTWLGQVALGRAYLALHAYPEAYSALEAALKRRGEATAVFLDDVPSYRYVAPVHYYMGQAQAGLKSRAAVESFRKYAQIRQHGDTHAILIDAQRRAGQP